MAKTEDSEWTIVKSKHEKILERKIQKEISSKNTEIGIMGNQKVFFGDKLILNNEILKNKNIMSYIKNNYRINKKLTERLSILDLTSLESKFKKQSLDLENYTCLSYPYKLGKLDKLDGNFLNLIHVYKEIAILLNSYLLLHILFLLYCFLFGYISQMHKEVFEYLF